MLVSKKTKHVYNSYSKLVFVLFVCLVINERKKGYNCYFKYFLWIFTITMVFIPGYELFPVMNDLNNWIESSIQVANKFIKRDCRGNVTSGLECSWRSVMSEVLPEYSPINKFKIWRGVGADLLKVNSFAQPKFLTEHFAQRIGPKMP